LLLRQVVVVLEQLEVLLLNVDQLLYLDLEVQD
jgi:hypothetical protein